MKRFFKPTKWNITFFVLLLYPLFLLLLFFTSGFNLDCAGDPDTWPDYCGYNPPLINIQLSLVGSLVVTVVLSYLLACGVVYLFNKINKK